MPPLAAIDCGTNSTRLLIADEDNRPLERLMEITRLGRGVDATGALEPAAIARTVDTLTRYRAAMDRHGVEKVRITATSAARDASNSEEFFDAAERIIGARPELIAGSEEGELSFRGATADLDPADGPFLVVDIGGGSTEFAVGAERCEAVLSLDMGCVRLTEKYLHTDPPTPYELSACLSVVDAHLDDLEREIPRVRDTHRFVGLAGTITTVAAVELGQAQYDGDAIHHFVLTRDAAEDVFRTLATETIEQRRENPGMDPQRADVIVGGCCVLVAIMRRFGLDDCLVSEADILDGLVLSLR